MKYLSKKLENVSSIQGKKIKSQIVTHNNTKWFFGKIFLLIKPMVNRNSDIYDDLIIQCIEDELQIRLLEEQEENYNVLSKNELEEIVNKKDENFKRIIFIKTHKTGSSTIQNIFYRYATGTLIVLLVFFCPVLS